MIPLYYREIPIRVIRHYRNWGAIAAGRSPWSVIRKEVFSRDGLFLPLYIDRRSIDGYQRRRNG